MRLKKFTKVITEVDLLDISLLFEENKIIRFSLNYRAFIRNKWYEVYRIDNFHGFLHEQKFWRSKKPIPLEEVGSQNEIIKRSINKIQLNFIKFRYYYEKSKYR